MFSSCNSVDVHWVGSGIDSQHLVESSDFLIDFHEVVVNVVDDEVVEAVIVVVDAVLERVQMSLQVGAKTVQNFDSSFFLKTIISNLRNVFFN